MRHRVNNNDDVEGESKRGDREKMRIKKKSAAAEPHDLIHFQLN